MSEQGWRDFLTAEGVDDWVVLHGGATAVFRVESLSEAAHLAAAVADTPGLHGRGVLLTIAHDRLTVRLSRDIWQLQPAYIQFARMVSAVARDHGGHCESRRRAGGPTWEIDEAEVIALRDAYRCVRCTGARKGAACDRAGSRRPYRGRVPCAVALDPVGPCR